MARIRDVLKLEPVEFPTTRRSASPAERATDIEAAFADDSVRAIFATIGGDDQITVISHLRPDIARRDPKPFFGFSDNTNLLSWLAFHGVPSVYGGSTQMHLGPDTSPHPLHVESLRVALSGGDLRLTPADAISELGQRWGTPPALTAAPEQYPAEPWSWSGPQRTVRGRVWGGCLEVLSWILGTDRWVHPPEHYAGGVLLLETSEELPSPLEVYRMLRVIGERGLLAEFDALVWGRPIVENERMVPSDPREASQRRAEYRERVLRAVAEYRPDMVVVMDVDCGHTIPQIVLPYGDHVTVDGMDQTITAHFDRT